MSGGSIDLGALKIGALLNSSSGSCDAAAESDLRSALETAGLEQARFWIADGGGIEAATAEATGAGLDLLIVLGGDGTIRGAAEACGPDGPLVMPLPGGTMNMLPRCLYGDRPWRAALKDTLAAPAVQPVHGGKVGGHTFYIAAIFGGSTHLSEAREALRHFDVAGAVGKSVSALKQAFSADLRYRFGDLEGEAETVVVLTPLGSQRLASDEAMLEAAAVNVVGAADTVRLALSTLVGTWRDDPTVAMARLLSAGIGSAHHIPALLDGEAFNLGREPQVEVVQKAFRALRPAGD